jgi:hypothetical protein
MMTGGSVVLLRTVGIVLPFGTLVMGKTAAGTGVGIGPVRGLGEVASPPMDLLADRAAPLRETAGRKMRMTAQIIGALLNPGILGNLRLRFCLAYLQGLLMMRQEHSS